MSSKSLILELKKFNLSILSALERHSKSHVAPNNSHSAQKTMFLVGVPALPTSILQSAFSLER